MFLEETREQQALRRELRVYYSELMTDEVRSQVGDAGEGGELWRAVVRRIGNDGWLGIGWPEEYGGQGRPATDQYIFFDETRRAGAPFPFVTINTVGPTLMLYGSQEQKEFFLPRILSGEINFAIGYTEPEAGTDLASLRTRAVRHDDEYVINGAKVFTSGADIADYVWLAVRTDPEAPKHKGISILCVPTDSPGFSFSPITTVGDATTTATYYADVRVPTSARVGEENEGWRMITTQLNHERVGLAAWSGLSALLCDEVGRWASVTPVTPADPDAGTVLDLAWVRLELARCRAEVEAMQLLNWRMACALAAGQLTAGDSSAVKVFGVEHSIDVYRRLLGVVGTGGYLAPGSPGAILGGRLERAARGAQINTFGGGVNEVQREIVAMAALHMARANR